MKLDLSIVNYIIICNIFFSGCDTDDVDNQGKVRRQKVNLDMAVEQIKIYIHRHNHTFVLFSLLYRKVPRDPKEAALIVQVQLPHRSPLASTLLNPPPSCRRQQRSLRSQARERCRNRTRRAVFRVLVLPLVRTPEGNPGGGLQEADGPCLHSLTPPRVSTLDLLDVEV